MSFLAKLRDESDPEDVPRPVSAPPAGRGTWEPTAYAQAALNAECAQIQMAPEGTRNDTLNRAAYNLAQLIAGGQISEPRVTDALTAAGHAAGLEAREIAATIRSGYGNGNRRARTATPRETAPAAPMTALTPDQAQGDQFIDWDALWADQTAIQWLCEPILPAGRLVSLYSPPGVGKSLLALELAAAITRGAPCLGTDTQQHPVLYLDYENVELDVRDRLQNMGLAPADLRALHYWSFPTLPPLDSPEGGQALLQAASHVRAGLVFIVTLSRCVAGDENDAATILALYRCTLMPLKAAGIAVLRLDHTGKDETKGQRGTSAKSGDVDLVWRYEEVIPDQQFLLTNEKHRIRIDELTINIRRQDSPLAHHVDTRTVGQAKRDAILDALRNLPLDTGRDVARRTLDQAGIKVRNETLANILRERRGLPPAD